MLMNKESKNTEADSCKQQDSANSSGSKVDTCRPENLSKLDIKIAKRINCNMKIRTQEASKKFTLQGQGLGVKALGSYDSSFFENQIMDERLLDKREISEFLGVSVKMIDRKVMLNEIPYLKIGRLVRFSKQKVLRWAEDHL